MLNRLGEQSCMQTSQALARICRVEDGPIASLSHVSTGSGWTFQHVPTPNGAHMQRV
jgi:hypothetical protein